MSKKIIERAKIAKKNLDIKKEQENIKNCFAWLNYTGLLLNNLEISSLKKISLDDLIEAAQIEPRINELIPVILTELGNFIYVKKKNIPQELKKVLNAINNNKNYPIYAKTNPESYLQWFNSPAIKNAKNKLLNNSKPRTTNTKSYLSEIVKKERLQLGLTQIAFVKKYKVSLRVLRSIEQGSENITLSNLNKILLSLNKKLEVL